jgi:hypothetical protein
MEYQTTMANLDFSDREYVSTDGLFRFSMADVHPETVWNAFVKQADHVYGNEAISKASTAKKKTGDLTDDERADIVLEARNRYLADMVAGTWGLKGNRAPRTPGATRLEQIINNITANDTRAAIAKAGYKEGAAKNTWLTAAGDEYTLADWMQAYVSNETMGKARVDSIRKRAEQQLETETLAANEKKAAREREGRVAQGEGLAL